MAEELFHEAGALIDRAPSLGSRAAGLRQQMVDERLRHRAYSREVGDDPREIRDWTWPSASGHERAARP